MPVPFTPSSSSTSSPNRTPRAKGSLTQTPHATLGVPDNASTDEIRRAYRARLIATHPDKPNGSRAAFDAVRAAYERVVTGTQAMASSPTVIVTTVGLLDRDVETSVEDGEVSYPCRCGDEFRVPLEHIDNSSAVVTCHGCSLSVIIFDDRPE